MRTNQFEFIDAIIDPIPVFGPILADLFYTWTGLSDAMNLRQLARRCHRYRPATTWYNFATKARRAWTCRKAA
jgi:hypothetical protein